MSINKNYEMSVISQLEMIKLIKTDWELYDLLVAYRDNYMVKLSDKFYRMPIDKLIKDDKNYFRTIDKTSKIYYVVCYHNEHPVGLGKFIDFGSNIKNIDFFKPVYDMLFTNPHIKKNKLHRFIYLFGAYVSENYRNKGVCQEMTQRILTCMKSVDIQVAIVDIKDSNIPSIKGIEKMGFVKTNIVSRPPDVYFYTFTNNV